MWWIKMTGIDFFPFNFRRKSKVIKWSENDKFHDKKIMCKNYAEKKFLLAAGVWNGWFGCCGSLECVKAAPKRSWASVESITLISHFHVLDKWDSKYTWINKSFIITYVQFKRGKKNWGGKIRMILSTTLNF